MTGQSTPQKKDRNFLPGRVRGLPGMEVQGYVRSWTKWLSTSEIPNRSILCYCTITRKRGQVEKANVVFLGWMSSIPPSPSQTASQLSTQHEDSLWKIVLWCLEVENFNSFASRKLSQLVLSHWVNCWCFFLSLQAIVVVVSSRLYSSQRILLHCVQWYVPLRTIRKNEYIHCR